MSAPESFIEMVRAGLVTPRRNVQRALDRARDLDAPRTKADYDNALYLLEQAEQQITDLEEFVAQASQRTVHTCSCGHTHYLRGDSA